MGIPVGRALKYSLLPGIVPRTVDFVSSGFSHVAVFIACVFCTVRLLPPAHPYLSPANMGRFGIRHVLGEARRNLVFDKRNIDQILIYYIILLGFAIIFMQVLLLVMALTVKLAFAAPGNNVGNWWRMFFTRPNAFSFGGFPVAAVANVNYDLAFILLDSVFGIPGIYNSCVAQGISCNPLGGTPPLPFNTPFHIALRLMFNFYNLGVCAVGLLVFLYLVVTVVGETAQTGTPFGRRFNRAWAVPRMIIAVALLAPLTWGLNGAQLVTLRVAKWGSNLASNSWDMFSARLAAGGVTALGVPANLVINPQPPEFNTLLEFFFLARTCEALHEAVWESTFSTAPFVGIRPIDIDIYQVDPSGSMPMPATFATALVNSNNHDIVLRVGEQDLTCTTYEAYTGCVKPICGEVTIEVKELAAPGVMVLQSLYYDLIRQLWFDPPTQLWAESIRDRYVPYSWKNMNAVLPTATDIQGTKDYFSLLAPLPAPAVAGQTGVAGAVAAARAAVIADPRWLAAMANRGWGGAALWYNRVAEINGRFVLAVHNIPAPTLYPQIMEYVYKQKMIHNVSVSGPTRYEPFLASNKEITYENQDRDPPQAHGLYKAHTLWEPQFAQDSGSPVKDFITAIFGLQGLFNLTQNVDVHPLAQLAGVGAALIESGVRNLGIAFGSGLLGGAANLLDQAAVGKILGAMSSFASRIAVVGMAMGFILYYVIPMLPFIYFFFALGGWVKAIFEAMVGLPLWALAHIRIDGEGIPGPAGMNGYYLIFEILLRPIMIVFGLLASMAFFTTMVWLLHVIWPQAVTNLVGADTIDALAAAPGETGFIDFVTDAVGAFFYTIMYCIVVYMIALSSFKLIDLIPNSILRWMGTSVTPFMDNTGDPSRQLVSNVYIGSQMAMSKATGGLDSIASMFAKR